FEVLWITAEDTAHTNAHTFAEPYVAFERNTCAQATSVSNATVRSDITPRSNLDVVTNVGAGVDDSRRVDPSTHRSRTIAANSASVATAPSIRPAPRMRHVQTRIGKTSNSTRSRTPGFTVRRNLTLTIDTRYSTNHFGSP